MQDKDLKNIKERYKRRVENLGENVKALGWSDKKQQFLRFDVLNQVGNLNNSSVLDVGCGFGDVLDFFVEKNIELKKYTGIDICEKVIKVARKKHPDKHFIEHNLNETSLPKKYDYVLSSGIFNRDLQFTDNYKFLSSMVKMMYDHCKIGVAFNLMTNIVDYEEDYLFYYNPSRVFKLCSEICENVVIRHDYPLYEFTVYLYKENYGERSK